MPVDLATARAWNPDTIPWQDIGADGTPYALPEEVRD